MASDMELIEISDVNNERFRTFVPKTERFKSPAAAFEVMSRIPRHPIDLGDGRSFHIQGWKPSGNLDTTSGYMQLEMVGYVKLTEPKDEVDYLKLHGWELILSESDGCETWSVPFERRVSLWSDSIREKYGTQHYWDRADAVSLQRLLDGHLF